MKTAIEQELFEAVNQQMNGMQKLFMKESKNILEQYNTQRVEMLISDRLLSRLASIVVKQELVIEDVRMGHQSIK